MRKLTAIIICSILTAVSCATPTLQGPGPEHGFSSAMSGFVHLVLSPFQIAAGLLEGVAAMPYFLATNIHEVNKGMVQAQAKITLDDTYDAAYGRRLAQVPESGETGEVFRRMKHATQQFQKVLRSYGVSDYDKYILTSIDTANSQGYTLFAVVYRPSDSIKVIDKYDGSTVRAFAEEDRLFYEPFEKDVNGRPLDTIVDWAGIPRSYIETQKAQAIFITMAANSVLSAKKGPDYWLAEKRWIAGQFQEIADHKMSETRKAIGL